MEGERRRASAWHPVLGTGIGVDPTFLIPPLSLETRRWPGVLSGEHPGVTPRLSIGPSDQGRVGVGGGSAAASNGKKER